MARQLAQEPWLAFACGRYEGIDERVYEHARETLGLEVSVVSLGDYVLNGGEVAVLAMVEAIGRLVPGVIGNAESLVEESHEDGLLEYPIYTKPREWNGREVPPILLSGNHAAIAAWRHEQRLTRTAARRPDLLHASHGDGEVEIAAATPSDVPELNVLFKACWVQEALLNDTLDIPALTESLDDVRASLDTTQTWVARKGGRLVGAVRTLAARATTGSSAASASCPTCAAGDSADACSSMPSRPRRTAYGRCRSTPGRSAPTTCGCTGRPATASCRMRPTCPSGAVHLTKRLGR